MAFVETTNDLSDSYTPIILLWPRGSVVLLGQETFLVVGLCQDLRELIDGCMQREFGPCGSERGLGVERHPAEAESWPLQEKMEGLVIQGLLPVDGTAHDLALDVYIYILLNRLNHPTPGSSAEVLETPEFVIKVKPIFTRLAQAIHQVRGRRISQSLQYTLEERTQ